MISTIFFLLWNKRSFSSKGGNLIDSLNVYYELNKYKYNKMYGNFGIKCFGIMKKKNNKPNKKRNLIKK